MTTYGQLHTSSIVSFEFVCGFRYLLFLICANIKTKICECPEKCLRSVIYRESKFLSHIMDQGTFGEGVYSNSKFSY
jgi:hypothetical protein